MAAHKRKRGDGRGASTTIARQHRTYGERNAYGRAGAYGTKTTVYNGRSDCVPRLRPVVKRFRESVGGGGAVVIVIKRPTTATTIRYARHDIIIIVVDTC